MDANFTMYDGITATKNGSFITLCLTFPPKINSNGVWGSILNPSENARSSPLPLLEVQMLMIFCVTMFLHMFLKLFGLPVFVSQMIAGLLLGPSWSGNSRAFDRFKDSLFFIGSQDILGLLSGFGYTLFVFLIGVKMDLSMIKKAGRSSYVIGILSTVLPVLMGLIVALTLSTFWKVEPFTNIEFIAANQSYTSFAVVLCLLEHLKILNSELGRLALSSTVIADMVGLGCSITAGFFHTALHHSLMNAFVDVFTTIGSFSIVVFIFRPAMVWIVRSTPQGRPVQDGYIFLIILFALVSAVISNIMGRTIYFGPFILGLAVPEGPPLGASLVEKLDSIISSVFVPLFVTVSVIKADLSFLNDNSNFLIESIVVILITSFMKMAVCFGTSLYFKTPVYNALAFGFIMSTKGIIELAASSYLYDSKALTNQTFAVLVVDILILSTLMPMLVKYFYDPSRKYDAYQRRDILNLKLDAELRILGCLHTQNDVPVLLNLLDSLCPTEESPVFLYALHLAELAGRATPVFISHHLEDQKDSSEQLLSSNVIQMLRKYERSNRGIVSVEVFTAIAPMKLMHEDICTLAVDKLTSLLILPFHRKWTIEGDVESEDNAIRAMNCSVLDRAPCSVGILIDRGHFTGSHSFGRSSSPLFQVAMIFIGGQDDREAFSFARRMVKEVSSAQLTVIRLMAEDESISHWEKLLDTELLNEMKHSFVGGEPFRYVELRADEGSETARIVRTVSDEYDLVVVGRRDGVESPQTAGLMEWNEFPELGIIGDMLASGDSHCKASTLVVQQQHQWM